MNQKVLLVSPPFTQLNTPYPATAYLKGFLNSISVESQQVDLGMETILQLFSKEGLENVFKLAKRSIHQASENSQRIFALQSEYVHSIDAVIQFLQDKDPTLAHFICERNFLPEASKFQDMEDLDWAFGTMGIRDQARHLATLYLEDLSDFIVELIDPHFGFSRYAERLGISANSFDELKNELDEKDSYIVEVMLGLLKKKIQDFSPTLLCISIPFPGNLFAALKCGAWVKKNYPSIKVALGGGYPNTELRSLSDARVFQYTDFICLDDGERPLENLMQHLQGERELKLLKRTFALVDKKVVYCNGSIDADVRQENVGTPDYRDLDLKSYLSVIQLTNPMHRLWSDGRWNKLTMAHGCYWGKCTFCDISLDYIKNYEANSAILLVDRMEELIEQTGERGFHFVDEAAPPALMKSLALEILKRKLVVTWWTNIRFEKSFHYDLCRLLSASGCIAISGGLEVASDRLLELIAKGVTVKQVARVTENFNRAGIMVHAYLMYGFPTQTAQETIDSLEVVRQLFEVNVLQSAFWHRFAMTAHSPVGLSPDTFKVKAINKKLGSFANNDLVHEDPTGADHELFSKGLAKSLYNFMHGVGFDYSLQEWFDHKVPETSLKPHLIESYLQENEDRKIVDSTLLFWIGGTVFYDKKSACLKIIGKQENSNLKCSVNEGLFLENLLRKVSPRAKKPLTMGEVRTEFIDSKLKNFDKFWSSNLVQNLLELGLIQV